MFMGNLEVDMKMKDGGRLQYDITACTVQNGDTFKNV